jgi:hypothetical protein
MDQPNLAKNEPPLYLCAQCNEPVFFVEGIIYRPCGHEDAPVLANLQAMVYGKGTAQ